MTERVSGEGEAVEGKETVGEGGDVVDSRLVDCSFPSSTPDWGGRVEEASGEQEVVGNTLLKLQGGHMDHCFYFLAFC